MHLAHLSDLDLFRTPRLNQTSFLFLPPELSEHNRDPVNISLPITSRFLSQFHGPGRTILQIRIQV